MWVLTGLCRLMRYEGQIYRPPSEAKSLILQATIGCSHNKCTFCVMYKDKKYRERSLEDIRADIQEAKRVLGDVRRVFLADGNALAMEQTKLMSVLRELSQAFPSLERVGIYANPGDLLGKSVSQLRELKEAGIGIVYLGVETGNDKILEQVRKDATAAEIIQAGRRAKDSGIPLSVTVINGLGGYELMKEHAADTAKLLNEMDPDYLGLLTLMVAPGTPIARQMERDEFQLPGPMEILAEIEMMLEPLELTNCVFRSNHASNYLPLGGVLPRDKEQIMQGLRSVLDKADMGKLRPEQFRGL